MIVEFRFDLDDVRDLDERDLNTLFLQLNILMITKQTPPTQCDVPMLVVLQKM